MNVPSKVPVLRLRRQALLPQINALALPLSTARPAWAGGTAVRVGVQKYGTMVVLRQRGTQEPVLARASARSTGPSSLRDRKCWKR